MVIARGWDGVFAARSGASGASELSRSTGAIGLMRGAVLVGNGSGDLVGGLSQKQKYFR